MLNNRNVFFSSSTEFENHNNERNIKFLRQICAVQTTLKPGIFLKRHNVSFILKTPRWL